MTDKCPSTIQRVKSLASKHLPWNRKQKDGVNLQLDSPLFNQLPQELRDRIWEFLFDSLKDAKPAHFHVFDEVYDACTYQKPKNGFGIRRAALRKAQDHIAVLMTCRRIYNEALHYLYDHAHFTFVVLAGHARQYCSSRFEDRCKSLGKIKDCDKLFQRIRNLNIIIQPGKNPHADLYNARLKELIKALEYGKHLVKLTLTFNWRLEICDYDPKHERRTKIIQELYPLQQHLAPKVMDGRCRLAVLGWDRNDDTDDGDSYTVAPFERLVLTLAGLDGAEAQIVGHEHRDPGIACELVSWDPMSRLDKRKCVEHGADMTCLERGAFGDDMYAIKNMLPTPRTPLNLRFFPNVTKEQLEMATFLTAYTVTLPISLPLTAWIIVARKKMKGEWK